MFVDELAFVLSADTDMRVVYESARGYGTPEGASSHIPWPAGDDNYFSPCGVSSQLGFIRSLLSLIRRDSWLGLGFKPDPLVFCFYLAWYRLGHVLRRADGRSAGDRVELCKHRTFPLARVSHEAMPNLLGQERMFPLPRVYG